MIALIDYKAGNLTSVRKALAAIGADVYTPEQPDDLARAITTSSPPEVDGTQSLRSVAISYGFLESERTGRILPVTELLDGRSTPYQDELDALG